MARPTQLRDLTVLADDGAAFLRNPLSALSRPLTYPLIAAQPHWTIDSVRREKLRQRRHFLVCGLNWMRAVGMPLKALTDSGYRASVYGEMKKLGPVWQSFVGDWLVERGRPNGQVVTASTASAATEQQDRSLGKAVIGDYLAVNTIDRFMEARKLDARYLSLGLAVTFLLFVHLVAAAWFEDRTAGKGRREKFDRAYAAQGLKYYEGFAFDFMWIEPVIYKLGSLGDASEEVLANFAWSNALRDLTGEALRAQLQSLAFKPDFVDAFKTRFSTGVVLPFSNSNVRAEDVLRGLLVEDRCGDLVFVQEFANFVTGWLGLTRPASIRAGSTFKGPNDGIVIQRYLEIFIDPANAPQPLTTVP